MIKIYDVPTQIYFTIKVDHEAHYGVAFGRWVICADDGDAYTLDEVNILEEFIDWVDFTKCIRDWWYIPSK